MGALGTTALCVSLGMGLLGGRSAQAAGQAQTAPPGAAGAALYVRNCQICHGVRGSGGIGPAINKLPPQLVGMSPEALVADLTGLVRQGIPGYMPSFLPTQLSDADIGALLGYLGAQDNSVASPTFAEASAPVRGATGGRTFFAQTKHSVGGEFRDFWNRNGGLRLFGYPLSEEFNSVGEDGQIYRTQLFERARFELNPQAVAGQRIRLARLGTFELSERTYVSQGAGPSLPPGPPAPNGAPTP
jgi:mono/diheme cytochrome c family protein